MRLYYYIRLMGDGGSNFITVCPTLIFYRFHTFSIDYFDGGDCLGFFSTAENIFETIIDNYCQPVNLQGQVFASST